MKPLSLLNVILIAFDEPLECLGAFKSWARQRDSTLARTRDALEETCGTPYRCQLPTLLLRTRRPGLNHAGGTRVSGPAHHNELVLRH